MKKYTVYEIEKLTDGRLSKYKLTKSIENGELIAEKVESTKRGRGVPKYFIYEQELEKYLKSVGDQRKKKLVFPGEEAVVNSPAAIGNNAQSATVVSTQQTEIHDLKNRIRFLETENSKLVPILKEEQDRFVSDETRAKERRELLMELANMGFFSFKRKKEILQNLNSLS
jgi:hypothetical protein